MKKSIRIISLILTVVLVFGLCSCKTLQKSMSSNETEYQYTSEYIGDEIEDIIGSNSKVTSNTSKNTATNNSIVSDASTQPNAGDNTSEKTSSKNSSPSNSYSTSSQEDNTNKSQKPQVTICAPVQRGIYALGGLCPTDTEYILVSGANITETKIIPAKGKNNNYFMGQVKISNTTTLEIKCKQSGKELSKSVDLYAFYSNNQENLQTANDYMVTFGSNSQIHFYSALLSYSLSNVIDGSIREFAKNNISQIVNDAKNNNAEVIYLVVPSSSAVYPETVPSEYPAASGESIYQAFNNIATQCGAKIIYPLNIMKSHKNDGNGYKIYSNTDSHWTTYGAYWGIYELMNYIAQKHPSAKPRTVSEMKFYTTELYGGDSLFSFNNNKGFENYGDAQKNGGKTVNTQIKELTTLYSLKMPTDTLSKITRNRTSVYLTKDNEFAAYETNPNGTGLPSALIVRDSFGRTAYDMINDRFSIVNWLAEGDYESVSGEIYSQKPNYVIYIVSERNLIKVMLNKDASLKDFR